MPLDVCRYALAVAIQLPPRSELEHYLQARQLRRLLRDGCTEQRIPIRGTQCGEPLAKPGSHRATTLLVAFGRGFVPGRLPSFSICQICLMLAGGEACTEESCTLH